MAIHAHSTTAPGAPFHASPVAATPAPRRVVRRIFDQLGKLDTDQIADLIEEAIARIDAANDDCDLEDDDEDKDSDDDCCPAGDDRICSGPVNMIWCLPIATMLGDDADAEDDRQPAYALEGN